MVCPVEFPTFWILLIAKKNNPYLLELYNEIYIYLFFIGEIHVRGREEEIGHMVIIVQAE